MATKTVLNITPNVFTTVATGAGYAVATFLAAHFEPTWLSFLPTVDQAPAVALVGAGLSGAAGWLKKESAGATAAEQTVSADVAKTVEDAASVIIPVTYDKTTAPAS